MTKFEPGTLYGPKSGWFNEVRELIGEPPQQSDLFEQAQALPKGRWAYRVIWGGGDREGKVFTCAASTFRKWALPVKDQEWWQRVSAGEVQWIADLGIWFDRTEDQLIRHEWGWGGFGDRPDEPTMVMSVGALLNAMDLKVS